MLRRTGCQRMLWRRWCVVSKIVGRCVVREGVVLKNSVAQGVWLGNVVQLELDGKDNMKDSFVLYVEGHLRQSNPKMFKIASSGP